MAAATVFYLSTVEEHRIEIRDIPDRGHSSTGGVVAEGKHLSKEECRGGVARATPVLREPPESSDTKMEFMETRKTRKKEEKWKIFCI